MENKGESPRVPTWAAWCGVVVVAVFAAFMSYAWTTMFWREECVKRGVAKWTVVNDAGRTEFEWISK